MKVITQILDKWQASGGAAKRVVLSSDAYVRLHGETLNTLVYPAHPQKEMIFGMEILLESPREDCRNCGAPAEADKCSYCGTPATFVEVQ